MIKIFWDGKERQRAISLWSIGTFGGSGLSSLTGGIIASNLGWRWIFFFAIIVAVIALYSNERIARKQTGRCWQIQDRLGGNCYVHDSDGCLAGFYNQRK